MSCNAGKGTLHNLNLYFLNLSSFFLYSRPFTLESFLLRTLNYLQTSLISGYSLSFTTTSSLAVTQKSQNSFNVNIKVGQRATFNAVVHLSCFCVTVLMCVSNNTSVRCWRGQKYACWTWSLSPHHAASGCRPAACTSSPSPVGGERDTQRWGERGGRLPW